jgi:hypothetical protein
MPSKSASVVVLSFKLISSRCLQVFAGDNIGEEDEYNLDSDEETGEQIEGYLLKKGVNLINPWQSRWFIAQGHYLRFL